MLDFNEFTQKPWWPHVSRIPGWCSELELAVLSHLASQVPSQGAIIEIGGFAGRSAAVFGHSAPEASVISIDPWNYEVYCGSINHFVEYLIDAPDVNGDKTLLRGVSDFFDFFEKNTSECRNVRGLRGDSLSDHFMARGAHLIYIDGDHNEHAVLSDLRKWEPSLRAGGLLIGHDHALASVASALHSFLDELSVKYRTPYAYVFPFTSIWALIENEAHAQRWKIPYNK